MNIQDAALAIVRNQAVRFRSPGRPATVPGEPTSGHPAYLAARLACADLGFASADVEILARAWMAQTLRTGCFDAMLWPVEPQDFGIAPLPRAQQFARCPQRLRLYGVLPTAQWVARMAAAAVPTLQLRFKSTDPQAIEREVFAAAEAVKGTASLLFINDHWQAALKAGVYGIHMGQEDLDNLPPTALRQLRDSGLRLGISTETYADMLRADALAPSYIAMGAVFATPTKQLDTPPQGLQRLAAGVALLRQYPTVAIGGIDLDNAREVLATGVGSIAVVRALTDAANPEQAARQLMALTLPDRDRGGG